METPNTRITVETTANVPVNTAWKLWSEPAHITKWNSPSPHWHTPTAANDLRTGGSFTSRMEAKDGSMGFDFAGTYDEVRENEYIAYTIDDGRKVTITFTAMGDATKVTETFDAEQQNSVEIQKGGWQAIIDNFKKYAEGYTG